MNVPDRLQCAADGFHRMTPPIGNDRTRDAWPGLRWKQESP
jgi:hypothetical protein